MTPAAHIALLARARKLIEAMERGDIPWREIDACKLDINRAMAELMTPGWNEIPAGLEVVS